MKKKDKIPTITRKPLEFKDLKELQKYLTNKDVDWKAWKTRKTKSLADLFQLLKKGIIELHEDKGKPVLYSKDVGIDVCCVLTDETIQILVEKERWFNGQKRPDWRPTRHTLVSKIEPDESAPAAAQRIIVDALKFKIPFAIAARIPAEPYFETVERFHRDGSVYKNTCLLIELEPYELDPSTDQADSFPGIESRRSRQVILCAVPKSAYQLEHVNKFRGKKTVFEYSILRDRERYDPHFTREKYRPLLRD